MYGVVKSRLLLLGQLLDLTGQGFVRLTQTRDLLSPQHLFTLRNLSRVQLYQFLKFQMVSFICHNEQREKERERDREETNELNDTTHFYCIFLLVHELKIKTIN